MTTPSTTTPTAPATPPPAIIGTFEGKPTISFPYKAGAKKPFTFGVAKAKLILANLETLKQFVATNDK